MNGSKFVILAGGMVAGYAAKQLVELKLKPGELASSPVSRVGAANGRNPEFRRQDYLFANCLSRSGVRRQRSVSGVAGKPCPTGCGKGAYSHITDAEMKRIMQNAVDHVYRLLLLKENDPKSTKR